MIQHFPTYCLLCLRPRRLAMMRLKWFTIPSSRLEYVLPPTGGWGMGIDRMTMFIIDSNNIKVNKICITS